MDIKFNFQKNLLIILLTTSFFSLNLFANTDLIKILKVKGSRAVILLPKNYSLKKGELLSLNSGLHVKVLRQRQRKALVLLFNDHAIKAGDTFFLPDLTLENSPSAHDTPSTLYKGVGAKTSFPFHPFRFSFGVGRNVYNKFSFQHHSKTLKDLIFFMGLRMTPQFSSSISYLPTDIFNLLRVQVEYRLFPVRTGINSHAFRTVNPFVSLGWGFWSVDSTANEYRTIETEVNANYYAGIGVNFFPIKQVSISLFLAYGKIKFTDFVNELSPNPGFRREKDSFGHKFLYINTKFHF